MASLPIIGGAGGFMLGGGGFGATLIGARLGFAAAGLFSSSKSSTVRLPAKEGPRLADLRVQVSSYEQIIPQLFGTMRFSGNIIWHQDIKEHIHKHTESSTQSSGGNRWRWASFGNYYSRELYIQLFGNFSYCYLRRSC